MVTGHRRHAELVEEIAQFRRQVGVVGREDGESAEVELAQHFGQCPGSGNGIGCPRIADDFAQRSFGVESIDEAARRAQIGHHFRLDVEDVAGGRGEVCRVADEVGHLHADGDGFVRSSSQVERHLHGHPTPQLAFQCEVERSDDTDATLSERAIECGDVQCREIQGSTSDGFMAGRGLRGESSDC